ncbi:MAG: hypothetical protein NC218_03315 [Acetobacter sp.]|nr:hypothetical protein [Acetobacter sp.]
MANLAECSVRIKVNDLPKFKGLVRIVDRSAETVYTVEAFYSAEPSGPTKYKLVLKGGGGEICPRPQDVAEAYEKVGEDEWKKIKVSDIATKKIERYVGGEETRLNIWYETAKVVDWREVFVASDTECVLLDCNEIHRLTGSYPSIVETSGADIGKESIELMFLSKWDFPEPLESALNKLALDKDGNVLAEWQGAMSEPGMMAATDELGTADLGLYIQWLARCQNCYDIMEEGLNSEAEAENYTCDNCKDEDGQPTHCFGEPYVNAYKSTNGK